MKAIALKFGIGAGFILCILMTIPIFTLNKDLYFDIGEILGYISIVLSLLGVFFGIKNYRDEQLEGKISFGKGFVVGLLITLIASIIFGIFTYLLYAVITPDLSDNYLTHYISKIKNSGESQEIITRQISEVMSKKDLFGNPIIQGFIMFGTVFPIGLFISALSSSILKEKKPGGK